MKQIHTAAEWQEIRPSITKPIGFVPTMGALHEGHLSLLRKSKQENDITILSIFINPTQFNDTADYNHYPNTLEADLELIKSLHIDYVFTPQKNDIYPPDDHFSITESHLSLPMEGKHRPGHFNGVLTVVMKLLNLIQAHQAYFGEKDYQQLQLVQALKKAFFIPTNIIPCPIIREPSGLAMSSRNQRLSATGKTLAADFYHTLSTAPSDEAAAKQLSEKGFKIDYITTEKNRRFGAVFLENIRLIDNVPIVIDP